MGVTGFVADCAYAVFKAVVAIAKTDSAVAAKEIMLTPCNAYRTDTAIPLVHTFLFAESTYGILEIM